MDLSRFSTAQREAIVQTEGPHLVLAGAGSGKTSVLTGRIAYLIEVKRVDPKSILALTFTNKAAREMGQRIEKIVSCTSKPLWMGTFHSLLARILRNEAAALQYPRSFAIYDTSDSLSLIKSILKERGLDDQAYKPQAVLRRISSAKNQLISAQAYATNSLWRAEDTAQRMPDLAEVFLQYTSRCRRASAMDFDDLLCNAFQLFSKEESILAAYQQKFRYVLIDEFQDTNLAQYEIVRKISRQHTNLCVVGDDAQSIYAFRGADIQNILNFRADYPNVTTTRLEQNYRSTKTIITAAESIIRHNKTQLKKQVWTDNPAGEPIALIKATTDTEEGRLVAASIFTRKAQYCLSNKDFAVLYRTNSQSRSIEESLRRANLPYRVLGGLSFYQRKEVKDLLGYLRFVVNPNDEESFKRIINLPKRGIGPSSVAKLLSISNACNLPIWEVLVGCDVGLEPGLQSKVRGFAALLQPILAEVSTQDAYSVALQIIKRSGLLSELNEDKTENGQLRYENAQELINAIKSFVETADPEANRLDDFLQEVALSTEIERSGKPNEDVITLMTIHAAKGLEFDCVYIVGMEEELFPSLRMTSQDADLEEERRLFYVAVTRARRRVCLSYALSRYRFGRLKPCNTSRFLSEIDPSCLHMDAAPAASQSHKPSAYRRSLTPARPRLDASGAAVHRPVDWETLRVGTRVRHASFGVGTVTTIDTRMRPVRIHVEFDTLGRKVLLATFAKLTLIK